jgi:REP element-mobilizing transposase RayT
VGTTDLGDGLWVRFVATRTLETYTRCVLHKLQRIYEPTHLHFITFSCYRRLPLLRRARRRDAMLRVVEEVRERYRFPIVGYVLMPEHVHLLIGLPEKADPSVVLKVSKQTGARRLKGKRSSLGLFPDSLQDWPVMAIAFI